MNEFDWIKNYLQPLAGPEGLKLLDDAALFKPRKNQDLILTKDTLVEGIHFFPGEYGASTAERLMAVNLSDLAAKGARPLGYLLSIAWPNHLSGKELENWMVGFCKGLETQQNMFDFRLFGGDTVRIDGPMTVSATFIGTLPTGEMVKRSGAKAGDDVWVTGTIGDAYLGLQLTKDVESLFSHNPSGEDIWTWEDAFRHPKPRLLFRKTLRKYATACADISDGLLSEANHISIASELLLRVQLESVPLSKASKNWVDFKDSQTRYLNLVSGGDDYELLFTANSNSETQLLDAGKVLNIPLKKIGKTLKGRGLECIGFDGNSLNLSKLGYSH